MSPARLVRLRRARSTQDEARALAGAGAAAGTVVWALEQTAGRGRLGRRWRSAAGGLYFSMVLRPRWAPERLADFSLECGAALAAALGEFGVRTAVKPPNDVLALSLDGRWRKLAGVLCEASGGESRLDWLVVGVGVNVNNDPPLRRAVSLRALAGRRFALRRVLDACAAAVRRAARAIS